MKRLATKIAAVAAVATFGFTSAVEAKSYVAEGTSSDGARVAIHFEGAKKNFKIGKDRDGKPVYEKRLVAKQITNFEIFDAEYTCTNDPDTGLSNYFPMRWSDGPVPVKSSGRFTEWAPYISPSSGNVLQDYTFVGTAKPGKKGLTFSGKWEARISAGGIDYGYCGNAVNELDSFKATIRG